MYHKSIFLFLLFFILSLRSFSAVFVVTSKADSGPGTLREALTKAAANGTTQIDYINFNLPDLSVTGRTITLESELPYVSSNVVIDASTQPGPDLNLGDARVKIAVDRFQYIVYGVSGGAFAILNVTNVSIFGLDIEGFFYLRNTFQDAYVINAGILIIASGNITIGAPGKGNFISNSDYTVCDNDYPITTNSVIGNIKIQSNYFDYGYMDGNSMYGGVFLTDDNVLFGGDTPSEGNHLLGTLSIAGSNDRVSNNLLGLNKDGSPITDKSVVIKGSGKNFTINNNKANSFDLELNGMDGFKVYANTDADIPSPSLRPSYIEMYECANGIIGSNDIAQQNIFHGIDNTIDGIGSQNSSNIQVLKNSLNCIGATPYIISNDTQNPPIIPNIKVLINNDTQISGTCNPGSVIYIYEDKTDCSTCNPQTFIQTVTTDANGIWKLGGNFANRKMLANALLNQNSSQYTTPNISYYDYRNRIVSQPSCHQNNGVIAIEASQYVLKMEWYDKNNVKVGDGSTVRGLGPGTYYAVGYNGNCKYQSGFYDLYDIEPLIFDPYVSIVQPSCGKGGSITGLSTTTNSSDGASYEWKDENNHIAGHESDINDLPPGSYTLTMTDIVTKCSTTYGPVVLKNATGPNINQTAAKIQSTNCGQSTGSITNISATGSGTLKYSWTNDQQQEVGTNKDLLTQPGGTYKLQVTDDTQCGSIYTTEIVIPETNGITLDESKVQTYIASCSQNNGTIKGISFTGATKFQWMDADNKVVSNTSDFMGAAPGVYTFTASNNFGCSKTSQPYTVGQQAPVQLPHYSATLVASCFGGKNGSVYVATDGLVKSLRWVDSQGAPAGDQSSINGVTAGTYTLYITDQNGCENLYNTYTIDEVPEYKVASTGESVNDQCGLKIGSISNVSITGGVPPYTYKWTNANNEVIGETSSITNLAAGKYVLNIVDTRCGNVDLRYTITDESADVAAPSVSDLQLCSSGSALLIVNNASSSVTYRLYDTQSSAQPIDEQKGGKFNIAVNANRSYFVTQLNGTCESSRTEVKVVVGLSVVNIANTFTPNGDGINDYWKITSIENYPDAIVQVFSRYGQKVYESKGYGTPFDGNLNAKELSAGVYYYIINLKTNCNILSGSLTIIR
ncbi:gliding motility-associated C-terminal domain-containing protein [Mucilaginibacter sp.]|uniref:gliding motility-associated C-terminal domain-containing protein n=1 Tax=Mucilaginibacter sp. TaxID=1882438 RepID=UPI002623C769|nr:gliding motility-associated C-terminal domain-containing protein [Mucilaginibacter sp.]MDB4922651.1 hypothetical protein [Mucilaginibacter sp.]